MEILNILNVFQTYPYCLCDRRSTEDLKWTRRILVLKKVILSGLRSYIVKSYQLTNK